MLPTCQELAQPCARQFEKWLCIRSAETMTFPWVPGLRAAWCSLGAHSTANVNICVCGSCYIWMSWTGNVREERAPQHLLPVKCFMIPQSFILFSCWERSFEKIRFYTSTKLTRLCFSNLQYLMLVSFPMAMAKGCARGKILACSPEAMADDNHLLSLFNVQSRKSGRTARCQPQ